MKTNPIIIGLIVAVAALGFWMAKIDATVSEANNQIAALDKKVAVALHDVAAARTQSTKTVVEYVSASSASGNTAQAAKNQTNADPRAALTAAQAMSPGPERDSAMQAALIAIAATDPQAAWDFAQNLPDDGNNFRLNTLRAILKMWSAKDPAQAAAKLVAGSVMETSDNANNTTGAIASNWLKQDPEAASKWVDSLPPGSTRDSAVEALVEMTSQNDLPTAYTWASTMSNVAKRGGIITGIVRQWAKTDPDAATKAVLSTYTNNNNGRQATLLALIQQVAADTQAQANPASSGGAQ